MYVLSMIFIDCYDDGKEYKMDSLCEICIWDDEISICTCKTKLFTNFFLPFSAAAVSVYSYPVLHVYVTVCPTMFLVANPLE